MARMVVEGTGVARVVAPVVVTSISATSVDGVVCSAADGVVGLGGEVSAGISATRRLTPVPDSSFLSLENGAARRDNANNPPTICPHSGQLRYFAHPFRAMRLKLLARGGFGGADR